MVTIDAATSALLTAMATSGARPLHELTPTQARAMAAGATTASTGPRLPQVSEHQVAVDGDEIIVRCYAPDQPAAVLVYFHGGGWVLGSLDEFDLFARTLAERTRSVVVSVGYRLAPEHPFPAAVHDAWAALEWAAAHRAEHGKNLPLVVVGDSSGANLAAVIAQRAHREGSPALAAQVLVYPATDCNLDTDSYKDPANQLLLSRDAMVWFWDHYADRADRTRPEASPLRAADLSGLPPAIVLTAEHDPLRDEGEAYAEKLRAAGVPVDHRRFVGQVHGFFTMVDVLPGAAVAMQFVVERLGSHVARKPTSA